MLSVIAIVVLLGQWVEGFGPVDLDSIDPITLSWNQIHWLVNDQIKEVEELKSEHDEIYNQITECFGLDTCVAEFDLRDIDPGRRLHSLGLRKMSVASLISQDLIRQREELHVARQRLEAELREKQRLLKEAEKVQRLEDEARRLQEEEEIRRRMEEQRRLANTLTNSASSSSSSSRISSSSSSSSFSSSSFSSSSSGGSDQIWGFNASWPDTTVYGPQPKVFDRRYEYSADRSGRRRTVQGSYK